MSLLLRAELITRCGENARIAPRNADELHDGLLQLGFLTAEEFGCVDWTRWFRSLAGELRACCVHRDDGRQWWVATERLAEFLALGGGLRPVPDPRSVWSATGQHGSPEAAAQELLRGRLTGLGPVTVGRLGEDFGLPETRLREALLALETEGFAISMGGIGNAQQWCERRLLARIHRYSREHRRQAARPVPPAAFMRFLLEWHGIGRADADLSQALVLLEGWVAPLGSWEEPLLRGRCRGYAPGSSGNVCSTQPSPRRLRRALTRRVSIPCRAAPWPCSVLSL